MVMAFLAIGLAAGIASGILGVGGGVLIVPALAFWCGFTQEQSVGTSLAVLLPPVGLAAVMEYYRQGNVNLKAALLIALGSAVRPQAGGRLAKNGFRSFRHRLGHLDGGGILERAAFQPQGYLSGQPPKA